MEIIIFSVIVGLIAFAIWGIFFAENKMTKEYQAKKTLDDNPSLEKNLRRMDSSFGNYSKELDERKATLTESQKKILKQRNPNSDVQIVEIGMTKENVLNVKGEPKYKDSNDWYYGNTDFKELIIFVDERVNKISEVKSSWIGMTKEMVLKSLGKPKYKDSSGWYYGSTNFNQLITFDGDKVNKISKVKSSWVGMTDEMVIKSLGKPKYKDLNGWYYGKKCFNQLISFDGDKVNKISDVEGLWIDMPLEMLIASYGKVKDEKKTVTKNGTKSKLYFGARRTRQKTTVYKIEVRVEDDKVVGWRDLE